VSGQWSIKGGNYEDIFQKDILTRVSVMERIVY
jgi:hypothetical protein